MKKSFYAHLIEIESLTVELDKIDLAKYQKHELAKLIDANVHNVIMDAIFSKLSEEEKQKFAGIVSSKDHEKIWNFLKSKIEDIENEIKKAALDIKKKLHEDIQEAKQK